MRRCFVWFLCLILIACETPSDYIKATGDFAVASNMVADAYREQLLASNTLEADGNLRAARLNPGATINLITIRDVRTFEPAALQVRIEAVNALVRYSNLLAQAAGEDIGANFAASVGSLKSSFDAVAESISELSGDPDFRSDLSKASRLFEAVAANIGQAIIEKKQAGAIRETLLEAEPDVSAIIKLMQMDLPVMMEIQGTKAEQLLQDAVTAYNHKVQQHRNNPKGSSFSGTEHERVHALVVEQFDQFNGRDLAIRQLSGALAALDAANQALVRAAQSPDQEVKTAEVLAAVQLLRMRATAVLEALAALKQ